MFKAAMMTVTYAIALKLPCYPVQTLNAVMKSEANRGVRMRAILRSIFDKGFAAGMHRLWFGAATRRSHELVLRFVDDALTRQAADLTAESDCGQSYRIPATASGQRGRECSTTLTGRRCTTRCGQTCMRGAPRGNGQRLARVLSALE